MVFLPQFVWREQPNVHSNFKQALETWNVQEFDCEYIIWRVESEKGWNRCLLDSGVLEERVRGW